MALVRSIPAAAAAALVLSTLLTIPAALIPPVARGAQSGKGSAPVPRFVEETATAGVEHRYDGEWEYFVGGGVAVFDCDADGRPDLYVAGGTEPAGLYRNGSDVGGALSFSKVGDDATDLVGVTGAYPIDVDADGQVDLAVLRRGENVLLRGLGACGFERANERWGFDGGDAWTTAFTATWEAGATRPTLVFGNYVAEREQNQPSSCQPSRLLRPDAGGRYTDVTELQPSYCTLSMLFSDWSRSGQPDLRVSNDRHYYIDGEEQLWRVSPGAEPVEYSADDGWQTLNIWGMGIASQDIDHDGLPEVYLTSMGDNKLQTLRDGPGQPAYRDIALKRGVTAHRPSAGGEPLPSTAWHAEFDDVNNDGRMDLYVAKGNVEAMPDHAQRDPNDLFLGEPDGTFAEANRAAGILHFDRTRGAAVVDLNLDGLMDIVEVNRREPVRIWRNVGRGSERATRPLGHWLGVELLQVGPNRDAVGSFIEVRAGGQKTVREVTIGGGHASGQLGPTHFGLGKARNARVRVVWPDGEVGDWLKVKADRRLQIERGAEGPNVLPAPQE